jgi:hypothetical protein
MEVYCIALPKPPRKPILSLGYSIIKHHGSTLLKGYCSCSKLHDTLAMPFIIYLKNTMGSITYLFKLGGVFPYQNLEGKQYLRHIAIIY